MGGSEFLKVLCTVVADGTDKIKFSHGINKVIPLSAIIYQVRFGTKTSEITFVSFPQNFRLFFVSLVV